MVAEIKLMSLVNPFVVVHPTHILMHPTVHRAHRLKSAQLVNIKHVIVRVTMRFNIVFICLCDIYL